MIVDKKVFLILMIKKICKLCIDTKNLYLRNSNFKNVLINNYISNFEIKKINSILEQVTKDNFMELKIFDIEISRYTLFNFLVSQKKSDLFFSDFEFERFKIRLKDSLKSLYGFKNILSKNKYDYVVAFSTEYSLNRPCIELADKMGIKVLNMGNGKQTNSKFNFLKISRGTNQGLYYEANENWDQFKKQPITNENFSFVKEYILSFLNSETFMNYSNKLTNKSIRQYFQINKKYKKIVLVALSSQDERYGDLLSKVVQSKEKNCKSEYFNDDLEWCEWLIQNIKSYEDIYFIIRFHPRSLSTKRNIKTSDRIEKIIKLSKQKYNNISFNFPDEPLSIYDFITETDLLLQSASSTSFEFGLFGIPSLTYDKNLYYFHNDTCFFPQHFNEYLDQISFLLKKENFDRKKIVVNAFRWLLIQLNYEHINISDVFHPSVKGSTSSTYKKYILRFVNKIQKHIGINFIVRNYLKKMNHPKNIKIFYEIFEKKI